MRCVATFFTISLLACPVAAAEVTDEQVDKTITAMKAFLYSQQQQDGSWEGGSEGQHHAGKTALVVLSLIMAGDSPQSPSLSRAIEWLARQDLTGKSVYALSMRAHVWAQMPRQQIPRLALDTAELARIAEAFPDGLFRYNRFHTGSTDLSCQQYGILGLWEAAKRDVHASRSTWKRHLDETLRQQNDDGGWGYAAWKSGSSGSMTCAGLTILYTVQRELYRTYRTPDPQIALAIERGLRWMDKHFDPAKNPGAGWEGWEYYYYLYSVERIGLAGGVSHFKGIDWYHACADLIVREAHDTGRVRAGNRLTDAEANTAFALMFLARGRYPVMVRKLLVPGMRCNDRPMDLAVFAQYLSDTREAEMNWQVVSADSDPYEWINSPILYLSSVDPIALTQSAKSSLKTYIDLGGTLVCTPDNSSPQFTASARALAAELYPDYPPRPLRSDDPIFEAQDPRRENLPDVDVISNGARNLIYIATSDWSYEFQAGRSTGKSPPWIIMTNIWSSATNRGRMPGRLSVHIEPPIHRDTAGVVSIQRVRHGGAWDPEPRAWEMAANHIWNRNGVRVLTEAIEMSALGGSAQPLAHLAGVDAVELGGKDLEAMEKYIRGGGTIFLETIGGMGDFSRALARQLGERLNAIEGPLPASHPVLTGEGLPGGYDNSRTYYRRYAALRLGLSQPVLSTLFLDNRPAVIISHHDVSLGALGARHWHVLGYDTDSARKLLTNLVLWTNRQRVANLGL